MIIITPVLRELHWLLIRERVNFKVACLVRKSLSGQALLYQTTVASCPTAIGALCGQLTFRLEWCHEHSAVTATELLQPRDVACGVWKSLPVQLCNPDITLRTVQTTAEGTPFSGKQEHGAM